MQLGPDGTPVMDAGAMNTDRPVLVPEPPASGAALVRRALALGVQTAVTGAAASGGSGATTTSVAVATAHAEADPEVAAKEAEAEALI